MHLVKKEVLSVQLGSSKVPLSYLIIDSALYDIWTVFISCLKSLKEVSFIIDPRVSGFNLVPILNCCQHKLRRILVVDSVIIVLIPVVLFAFNPLSIHLIFDLLLFSMFMDFPGILLYIPMMQMFISLGSFFFLFHFLSLIIRIILFLSWHDPKFLGSSLYYKFENPSEGQEVENILGYVGEAYHPAAHNNAREEDTTSNTNHGPYKCSLKS